MQKNIEFLIKLKQSIRFEILLIITISYSIGAGLVSYLGRGIEPILFWLGLLIVNLFFICSELISSYFIFSSKYATEKNKILLQVKNNFFVLFILFLTALTLFTFLINQNFISNYLFLIFWSSQLVFLFLYAIPPFKFKERGFGDILITLLVVSVVPMFSFIIQMNEIHSTLFLLTFPVIFLLLSYFLAQTLSGYANDIKNQKNTLMTQLGWKTGMSLHNLFLLSTYLLFGIAAIFGLPTRLAIPALFSFPVACIQFWEMWRIGSGYKPRWKLLKVSSIGSISLFAYFLLFNLWLR